MATPNVVPMFDPNGEVRMIPMDQVQAATEHGGKRAIPMSDPQGTVRYIPHELMQEALAHGGKLVPVPSQPTQFEQDRNPDNQSGGFLSTAASDLAGAAKGLYQQVQQTVGNTGPGGWQRRADATQQQMAQQQAEDDARKASGRSLPYRVAAAVAPLAGVNATGMEQAADVGNSAAILGHAAAAAAPLVVGEAAKGTFKAVSPRVTEAISNIREGNQANVMAEAAKLPPKVVNAAEGIFQAAAPTGMNKGFRANLYAAVPDLADVGRAVNLQEAKGGIVNPDMRVRATVNALRDHLDEMYQTERAPQIQRNGDVPIKVGISADAKRGLEYLQSMAPEEVRNAAQKALDGNKLTVAEADVVAQAANQNLHTFERSTPEGKLTMQTTNPKVGGLKQLDAELGQNLNAVLKANGEVGLQGYERRFAALSAIRDQLESRVNATELNTPGMFKKVIKPIASTFTGGTSGVASASQAAVSGVNIGKVLQKSFSDLADSGLTAKQ